MTKLYILHIYYTDDLYKDTYGYRTDIFNSKEKASVFAVKQLMKKILERCMDKGKFSASLFLEREIIDYGDKYEKFFDKSDEQLDKLKNELLDMYIQDMYDELYEDDEYTASIGCHDYEVTITEIDSDKVEHDRLLIYEHWH